MKQAAATKKRDNTMVWLWRILFVTLCFFIPRTVVILVSCILLHELGHYVAFRSFGLDVDSVCVGIGPCVWRYKDRRRTIWTLRLLPLFGYVMPWDERDLNQLTLWKRLVCFAAGPIINFTFSLGPILVMAYLAGNLSEKAGLFGRMYVNMTISTVEAPTLQSDTTFLDNVMWIEKQHVVVGFIVVHFLMLLQNTVPFPPFDGGKMVLHIMRSLLPSVWLSAEPWLIIACAGFIAIKMLTSIVAQIIN
jgi:membrane-associated protease RseP (regulator of RpoE activity)